MTLSRETMLELMSLVDGELEGEHERDVKVRAEKLVSENDDARRVVEAIRAPAIGLWLADAMDEKARAGGADSIADAVMARIDQASARSGEATSAVSPKAAAVVRSIEGRAPARRGWRSPRVAAWTGAACAALAAAAAVGFYVRAVKQSAESNAPIAGMSSVEAPSATAPGPSALANSVEVDEVDSPTHEVSVFEIPAGGAAAAVARSSSVVIWIDEEPATP